MAQPIEIIATLTKGGKQYPVIEFDQQNAGLSCQGTYGGVFETTIRKALASGYQIVDCTDERLRFTWKSLSERKAPELTASDDEEPAAPLPEHSSEPEHPASAP